MPNISIETPRETYTIAGEAFKIPQPYVEGHALTAGEASQLNQVFAENVRNNQASKIAALKEANTFDAEVYQGTIDDYCEGYEMGVRTGGGRIGDPVMAEAMSIARDEVRKALKAKGHKLADIKSATISELAKKAIEKYPEIKVRAQERVESAKNIAGIELDSLELGDGKAAAAA